MIKKYMHIQTATIELERMLKAYYPEFIGEIRWEEFGFDFKVIKLHMKDRMVLATYDKSKGLNIFESVYKFQQKERPTDPEYYKI